LALVKKNIIQVLIKQFYIFLILCSIVGFGNTTDSLLLEIQSENNYKKNCDLYFNLGNIYYNKSNYDSSIWAYKKGAQLSYLHSNLKILANFYYHIGVSYWRNHIQDSATHYFNETLIIAENIKDDTLKAISYANMSLVYKNKSEYNKAILSIKKAINFFQSVNDTLKLALCRYSLGGMYNSIGMYNKAVEEIIIASKIFESKSKTLDLAQCYNRLGNVFRKLKVYEKSIAYHEESLLLQQKVDNKPGIISSYINLGNTYSDQNKYSEAISSYKKADDVNKIVKDTKKQAKISINLGEVYLKTDDYRRSEVEIKKALKIFKQIEYYKEQTECLNLLSEIYLKTNKLSLAKSYLSQANVLAVKYDLTDELLKIFQIKKEYYLAVGKANKAIIYFHKIDSLKDSIYSRQKYQEVININTQYETEKKEHQIVLLEKENELKQTEIKQKAQQRNWLIAFFIAMLIVSGIIYFYYKKTKAAKNKIEMLQREIHHRVKNNLSIIKRLVEVTVETVKEVKGRESLNSLSNRIASMAQVHGQLYQKEDITSIDFNEYIKTLCENITDSFSWNNMEINQNIESNIDISFNKAVPLGLIINELLTNAYKHAGNGNKDTRVSITVIKKDDKILLTVSDNGKGFTDNFDIYKTESYGLKLVNGLTQQLNGQVKFSNNGGANVEVEIPIVN